MKIELEEIKKLVLLGTGGFGREVAWLVERINAVRPTWNLIGFLDDNESLRGTHVGRYPVIGGLDWLINQEDIYVTCTIRSAKVRNSIIQRLMNDGWKQFATLIDPSVISSDRNKIGEGTIVCAHTILTVDVVIGSHVMVNLNCAIEHDVRIEDYCTLYPSVNVSGGTVLGDCVEIGTGSQVGPNVRLEAGTIVGAGVVVARDLLAHCTSFGISTMPIKFCHKTEVANAQHHIHKTISNSGTRVYLSARLLIIGAGGHGRVVADIAEQTTAYHEIAYLDDDESVKGVLGYKVLGKTDELSKWINDYDIFVAIGNKNVREAKIKELEFMGASLPTIVHPSAVIGKDVQIGKGTVVMPSVTINCGSVIGEGCIINTSATIDHDCVIKDYVHISPGVHLAGTVTVGKGAWLGIGTSVSNNINIVNECKIGAGAVVVKDITETGTYVGVPIAKI